MSDKCEISGLVIRDFVMHRLVSVSVILLGRGLVMNKCTVEKEMLS